MNSQQAEACSVGEDDAFDLAARKFSRQRGLQPTPACNDLHSTLCRLIVATTQIDVLAPRYGCGRDDVRIRLMCSGGPQAVISRMSKTTCPWMTHSMMKEYLTRPASLMLPTNFWIGYIKRNLSRKNDMPCGIGVNTTYQDISPSPRRTVCTSLGFEMIGPWS
jgi:hypothetical protein